MNGRIKKVVSALGLALLISVPFTAYAMKGDYTIDDIGKDIQPPQYVGTDNKLIKNKIPSVEDWKKSVALQGKGGDSDAILIRGNQTKFNIKKTEKDGTTPIEGASFNLYENETDAEKGVNSVGTAKSSEDGFLNFEKSLPSYGFYVREESVSDLYLLRKDAIMTFYKDNGVRFLGEIAPGDMEVTSINQDGEEKTLDSSKNINQELQRLTSYGSSFNNDTNWLVFNENGKEKLVSKKPLKYGISWNRLYNAGVVFGKEGIDDLINADFTNSDYNTLKDRGKGKGTIKTYKPTYVTMNGKKYIVRLMRGYNDNTSINEKRSWSYKVEPHIKALKGSEWNRLILPLIDSTGDDSGTGYSNGTNGRYGSDTKVFVERNMPTLTNYSWWTDFGGNSNSLGNYNKGSYYGSWRWTQETGYDGSKYRAYRGYYSSGRAAAYANSNSPNNDLDDRGWLAVLERVDN